MKEKIDRKLEAKSIKPTAMRQLILEYLMESRNAVSLADLEDKFDYADRSTLYRTLKTFEKHKLIHCIEDGTGSQKYAVCLDACEVDHEDFHVHFLCEKCHQTYCLYDVEVPAIKLPSGFTPEAINLIVKGVCHACR